MQVSASAGVAFDASGDAVGRRGAAGCCGRRREAGASLSQRSSAGRRCITWRCRLPFSSRAWNELGVSIVCCLDSIAWGALTELCLNHGKDIFRLLLCCLGAAGGGVLPIAPADTCRRAFSVATPPSVTARGAVATAVTARLARAARSFSHARPLTTQPPSYRATFPEFIPQRQPSQRRAKDAPNLFLADGEAVVALSDNGAARLRFN